MELYCTGQIKPVLPVVTKMPSQVNEVIQSIPNDLGSGNCVISYDDSATFKVRAQSFSLISTMKKEEKENTDVQIMKRLSLHERP